MIEGPGDQPLDPRCYEVAARLFDGPGAEWTPVRGGMSQAGVWRVTVGESAYAVRQWPPAYSAEHVGWITQTLRGALRCPFLAVPLANEPLQLGRSLWEATGWIDGVSLESQQDTASIQTAMTALAAFHEALRDPAVGQAASGYGNRVDVPAWSVMSRIERLGDLLTDPPNAPNRATAAGYIEADEIYGRLPNAVREALRQLQTCGRSPCPRQVVHGDARPEHFLLSADRLAGLIDFGAMRIDVVEADVARLVGELAAGDRHRTAELAGIYAGSAAVSVPLILALDRANAVLSGANWLRWLARPRGPAQGHGNAEDRALDRISRRLQRILARMPANGDRSA